MLVKGFFAAYLILWIYLAFEPLDRFDWVLDNLLVFLLGPPFLYSVRRFRFSDASYILIIVYLMLCAIGAHWSYSFVPAGDWLKESFGLGRNHYDRIVHFSFGLAARLPPQGVAGTGGEGGATLAVFLLPSPASRPERYFRMHRSYRRGDGQPRARGDLPRRPGRHLGCPEGHNRLPLRRRPGDGGSPPVGRAAPET